MMGDDGVGERWSRLGVAAGLATCALLLAPWGRIGGASRSSVSLLSTAGALDLVDGPVRVLGAVCWFAVPALTGAAVLAVAWDRPRVACSTLVPIGPIVAAGWWIVASTDAVVVAWGAVAATVSGGLATVAGGAGLRPDRR